VTFCFRGICFPGDDSFVSKTNDIDGAMSSHPCIFACGECLHSSCVLDHFNYAHRKMHEKSILDRMEEKERKNLFLELSIQSRKQKLPHTKLLPIKPQQYWSNLKKPKTKNFPPINLLLENWLPQSEISKLSKKITHFMIAHLGGELTQDLCKAHLIFSTVDNLISSRKEVTNKEQKNFSHFFCSHFIHPVFSLVSWLEKIHFDSQKSKFKITSTTELKKDYCEYFLDSTINGSNGFPTFWKMLNIFLQRKFPHFSFGGTFTTKIKDV